MPNIGEDPEASAHATVYQRNSARIFLRASAEEEEERRRKHRENNKEKEYQPDYK